MKTFWSRFLGNPRVYLGLIWLGLLLFVAIAANLLAPTDPFAIVGRPMSAPSVAFPLGTVIGTLCIVYLTKQETKDYFHQPKTMV